MMELLYDCDLTMGIAGRDVDDGLALMAVLGNRQLRLLGVTSTFGNGTLEEVHPCLERALQELGAVDVPCHRGAASAVEPASPAAAFLAQTAARLWAEGRRNLRVLATGALTNLRGAVLHDPSFFRHVAGIVIMGGLTEPLSIGGRRMAELNLSCDPAAASQTLHSGSPVVVISGNLCLQAFLDRRRFYSGLAGLPPRLRGLLERAVEPWLRWYRRAYGLDGFHPWDAVAAAYLAEPGLFETEDRVLVSGSEELRSGVLRTQPAHGDGAAASGSRITLPVRIPDPEALHAWLFEAWACLGERLESAAGGRR
jgi:purine nucleosidase